MGFEGGRGRGVEGRPPSHATCSFFLLGVESAKLVVPFIWGGNIFYDGMVRENKLRVHPD